MSEPHTGPWQLRFLTVDEELQQADVLSFLTSNGVGNQVTVEPGIQPDKQTWFLQPVHGKKGYYTIIQDPTFESPPGLAQAKGSYKVILSKQPEVWRLEYVPIDLANGDVYKIHPPQGQLPVIKLLGKKGHEALIQISDKPAWQFFKPQPE